MDKVYLLSVSICTVLLKTDVDSLVCYSCSKISDPSTCNTTITCNTDEACYQESVSSGQSKIVSLGCKSNKQCGVTTSDPLTLIGRDIKRRQEQKCQECCGTDQCNEILCAVRNPAACIDDETIDCPRMNSVFGICKDIKHAKVLCPNFCGLCNVVDGVWTEWTIWSTCDVTCETGIQSRLRTCTNPAPAHGGQDCVGHKTETKQCQKSLCPIHGNWSTWETWGTCSVTCGIGIQRRQRTCTNPAPQRFGDHCFGLNMDDSICIPKACSDGGWTSWGNWGSCSVTCGDGFQSRSRTCTNPRPSLIGRYCDGDSSQVGSCNSQACGGIAFRCNGTYLGAEHNGTTIKFATVSLNMGNGYDNNTGVFTAPVAGTYLFSIQLCVAQGKDIIYAIVADSVPVKVGHFNDKDWTFCHSADTVAVLRRGSRAWVKCIACKQYSLVDRDEYSNTFSGVLVHG